MCGDEAIPVLLCARQAISDCTEAILDAPQYVKAYMRRAQSYEKIENYQVRFIAQTMGQRGRVCLRPRHLWCCG